MIRNRQFPDDLSDIHDTKSLAEQPSNAHLFKGKGKEIDALSVGTSYSHQPQPSLD